MTMGLLRNLEFWIELYLVRLVRQIIKNTDTAGIRIDTDQGVIGEPGVQD